MKQVTFTDIEYGCRKKKTKRDEFLEIMDEIIPWDEGENMFDFRSNGRLSALSAFDLRFGTVGSLPALGRSAVDFILDFLAMPVFRDGVFPLFGADAAAVAVYGFFFAGQKFRRDGHVMNIRRRDNQIVYGPRVLVHPDMCLVAKMPVRTLFHRMGACFWWRKALR